MANPQPSVERAEDQAAGARRWRVWADDEPDEGAAAGCKPLSREEAQAWRRRQRMPGMRHVLAAQALVWVLAIVGAWLAWRFVWPQRAGLVASVAWGGACAFVPALAMAWGMGGGLRGRWRQDAAVQPARSALARWLVWEGIKVLLALTMLVAAPRLVPDLSWPGLLVGLVVVLKGYVLAWWLARIR